MTPKVHPFGALLRTLMLLMGLIFATQTANAACASPSGNVGDHGLLTIPSCYFQKECKVVQRGGDDTFRLAFTLVVEPSITIPKP